MMSNRFMEQENRSPSFSDAELHLADLLQAYRTACPEPEPGVNFMPELWAGIEARQRSTHLFGRMARALVTAALAATVILGLMLSSASQPTTNVGGSYLEALAADHVSNLEPMNLERISEMEQQ